MKVVPLSPKIGREIPLPQYQTAGSAGIDLAACLDNPVSLAPGERSLVPTGIAIQLPSRHVGAFIFARSGLAAKAGIHLANGVGVVDSDYTGEVMCALVNGGEKPFVINSGDRIAQMLFMPILAAKLLPVDSLDRTDRGSGGFGHTGV